MPVILCATPWTTGWNFNVIGSDMSPKLEGNFRVPTQRLRMQLYKVGPLLLCTTAFLASKEDKIQNRVSSEDLDGGCIFPWAKSCSLNMKGSCMFCIWETFSVNGRAELTNSFHTAKQTAFMMPAGRWKWCHLVMLEEPKSQTELGPMLYFWHPWAKGTSGKDKLNPVSVIWPTNAKSLWIKCTILGLRKKEKTLRSLYFAFRVISCGTYTLRDFCSYSSSCTDGFSSSDALPILQS